MNICDLINRVYIYIYIITFNFHYNLYSLHYAKNEMNLLYQMCPTTVLHVFT